MRAVCLAYEVAVIPYSPLAGGFLTGKYRRDQAAPESKRAKGLRHAATEKNFALLDKMDEIAAAHHAAVAQVALAWMLAAPVITSPIIGATSVGQLNDNLGALKVKLSAEEKAELDRMTAWEE